MSEEIIDIAMGNDMASDPMAIANFGTRCDVSNINHPLKQELEEGNDLSDIPLGEFGFYTNNQAVFDARVSRIEADVNEVKEGYAAPGKWIRIDNIREALGRDYSWQ